MHVDTIHFNTLALRPLEFIEARLIDVDVILAGPLPQFVTHTSLRAESSLAFSKPIEKKRGLRIVTDPEKADAQATFVNTWLDRMTSQGRASFKVVRTIRASVPTSLPSATATSHVQPELVPC